MKNKNIKQWVFNKRKSINDIFGNARPNVEDDSPTTMDTDNADLGASPQNPPPLPTKTVFYAKGNPFRVSTRYSYLRTLGHGAYGVVCAANDAVLQRKVAIKKVAAVFEDLTDAKRIIREIRLLGYMKHDNVLRIVDIDEPELYDTFADVYIVTELMDTDLHKLLHSSHPLVESQRKYFAYQMLRALRYIHSASVWQCDIKICDFGLARYLDPAEAAAHDMTEYVVTRWYRAPELLLACDEYGAAIDMWSVGCVIAELYSRKPIFPGRDVKNQIELICSVVGKPQVDDFHFVKNHAARQFIAHLPPSNREDLRKLLPGAGPAVIDLVDRLLQFDPRNRLSAEEALNHPYVRDYRDVASEKVADHLDYNTLEPPNEQKLGKDGIRRLMWNEILKFHPDAMFREPQSAKDAALKVNYMTSF
eukprot:gb/GEZJ01002778.1/.p2 GENE.gb/GEZJ01002778.1/~~gb/GEZJ01002778.1/.p2  ORF type:complete len:419 (-),score=60.69 gb/GEZJ01002778.1/:6887-8143(-)